RARPGRARAAAFTRSPAPRTPARRTGCARRRTRCASGWVIAPQAVRRRSERHGGADERPAREGGVRVRGGGGVEGGRGRGGDAGRGSARPRSRRCGRGCRRGGGRRRCARRRWGGGG